MNPDAGRIALAEASHEPALAESRSCYRPHGEVICTREYEIVTMSGDGAARDFIEEHHYPGNHKYAWPLRVNARKWLPPSFPYPKFTPLFR